MESMFSSRIRKAVVSDVTYLSPQLKKITFTADLNNVIFKTGQAIFIRVDATNFRNYTPSAWNSEAGTCEVIFHLHGNGPGSNYISTLKVSDELNIGLPRGFDLYKKEYRYHFFFGDETTLGFFKSLKRVIEENRQNYLGVLEVHHSPGTGLDRECLLDLVPVSASKAGHAIQFLNTLPEPVWELWKTGMFYLLGNARSIQNFRKALKAKGISSRNILTQPYWMEGKTGL